MEPISAAATVLGLVSAIASVTASATAFMRDVRDARKEIVAVTKELMSLRAILEILEDDLNGPTSAVVPDSTLKQIVEITENCSAVVGDIGACIKGMQGSRLKWATSGKTSIEALRRDLEIRKSSLSVALDIVSGIVLKSVKGDTGQILQDTTTLKQDTAQIQCDLDRIIAQLSQLQTTEPEQHQSNYILERFLGDLKSDAATVLGDAEYLGVPSGDDSGDDDDQARGRPGSGQSDPYTHIAFTNAQGRRYPIPYAACQTWEDMAEIIQQSYANVRESEDVSQGRYDLVSTDGEIILKSLWARLVRPGWEIKMIMWPKQDPNRVEPIKFKDAVGRKFTFPFHIVKTWESAVQSNLPCTFRTSMKSSTRHSSTWT
ncbi:hypothetical protein B0T24DRAFT_220073 [Lasiosphaeria ovina]|uniref:Fungal N-terminal domain-containing protein n=1 Tax=Lasiosphaeria ovina TaxID=92902 RepID=A0AAE0KHU9_9PEZI|nr:hypothetical protein B0T24DRAFT_220073 [Lasiosphaeria ovina]